MLKFHRKLPFSKEKKCCLTSSANTLPNSRENPELQRILFEPPIFFSDCHNQPLKKGGALSTIFGLCLFYSLFCSPQTQILDHKHLCAKRRALGAAFIALEKLHQAFWLFSWHQLYGTCQHPTRRLVRLATEKRLPRPNQQIPILQPICRPARTCSPPGPKKKVLSTPQLLPLC